MQKTIRYKGQNIRYSHIQPESKTDNVPAPLTVMFVHGFPERGSIFQSQIAALSQHCALLIPDLPGSGDSPYNPDLHSIEDYADSLHAITATEQVTRLVMIGHSMGGYIALAFADKYPRNLLGLGLLHSTAYADSAEKKANRLKAIQTMKRYGGPAFLKSMIPTLFAPSFKAAHPAVIQELIREGNDFQTKALQQYYRMMLDRTDKTRLFSELPIPFLFISGTEDKAAPPGDLIAQSALPEIAMIEILDQAGHMGFIEKPGAVNRIVLDFLSLVQQLQE